MAKNEEQERHQLHAALLDLLEEAMNVDEAASGKIRIYNPDTGCLELRAHRGFSDGFTRAFRAVKEDDSVPCARAFRLRHRVAVPDVKTDPQVTAFHAAAEREGFRAMQTTPVIASDGRVLGTLSTHYRHVHHPSTAGGLILDHISRKAAPVLEKLALRGPRPRES